MLLLGWALLVSGCAASGEEVDGAALTGGKARSNSPTASSAAKPAPAASSSAPPSIPPPATSRAPASPEGADPGPLLPPIGCDGEAPSPGEGGRERLRAQVCGTVGPDDVDKFFLEAAEDKPVILKLSGAEVTASVAGCAEERRLGDGERLRLVPSRDCTLRIDVSTKRPEARGYILVRER